MEPLVGRDLLDASGEVDKDEEERQALDGRVKRSAYFLDNGTACISQLPSDHEEMSRFGAISPDLSPNIGQFLRSLGLLRNPLGAYQLVRFKPGKK